MPKCMENDKTPKRFALMGAAGYIAPRHLRAIKDTGNLLVAAYDPFDSVGIMDSFFPRAAFFTDASLFEQFLYAERQQGRPIDYVVVCTPNYLHHAHILTGLRLGAQVICEKPLVLQASELEDLARAEQESGCRVYTILQLRLHEAIVALKKRIDESPANKTYHINLRYITSRGSWYHTSWKGDVRKSGGLATNIGVHFFDMLFWIFGPLRSQELQRISSDSVSGRLELERARVDYLLSINEDLLPEEAKAAGKRTFRSLRLEGQEIEFSEGFTELHTESYRRILQGEGFGLNDVSEAIRAVAGMR